MGVLRDSDSAWYMREEAGGLILGPYEPGAPVCYVDGPSDDSEYELFQEALDRIEPHIESAIARVPGFGEVGIKKVYNGAIAYTPDGSPIVGPAPRLKNFWLNEGHSFGITAAGGAGWQLAEWIVDGEPTIDMMGVDPRRFGPYATEGYLIEKNEEAYANVFTVHYPEEERAAGRQLKTSPAYDRQKKAGAVFGSVYGWERANWYAPSDESTRSRRPTRSTRRSSRASSTRRMSTAGRRSVTASAAPTRSSMSATRCINVAENVGLLDMTPFAKIEVSGPGARAWLDGLLANRIPKKRGRVALAHLLTPNGGVRAEFTVYERAPNRFYLVSAGAYENHDHDYLYKALPADGSVKLTQLTQAMGVLIVAGPRSRDLLAKLTRTDLSNEAFPWLTGKAIDVGPVHCEALRVNFVGELGWELHHPITMQNKLWDLLMQAGEEFGIKPFGIRAMTSMAIEKSYRMIPRELSIEYNAMESGLQRFVHPSKGDFVGREAVTDPKLEWQFVTLEVQGVGRTDARGSEAIYDADGALVGRATHGTYGWRTGKSLALAMVRPYAAAEGTRSADQVARRDARRGRDPGIALRRGQQAAARRRWRECR